MEKITQEDAKLHFGTNGVQLIEVYQVCSVRWAVNEFAAVTVEGRQGWAWPSGKAWPWVLIYYMSQSLAILVCELGLMTGKWQAVRGP